MKRLLITILAMLCTLYAQGQTQAAIGNGSLYSVWAGPMVRNHFQPLQGYSRSLTLYTQAELAANGILPGSLITAMAWYKTAQSVLENGATATLEFRMRAGSSYTTYTTADTIEKVTATGFTTVGTFNYDDGANNLPSAAGWVTFSFATPYIYTGGNLEVYSLWGVTPGATGTPMSVAMLWQQGNVQPDILHLYSVGYTPAATNTIHTNTRGDIKITYVYTGPCAGKPAHATIGSSSPFACTGSSYTVSANGQSVGGGISYQWRSRTAGTTTFANIAGATQPSYTAATGAHAVDYSMITHCDLSGQDDTSNIITITPLGHATVGGITETHTGLTYTFMYAGVQNITNVLWHYGDGNTGTGNMHTYAAPGNYTVSVVVSNQCGADTATLNINAATGINDIDGIAQKIRVYPNPAQDYIVVTTADTKVREMKMTNAAGQTLKKILAEQGKGNYRISTSQLATGIYYLYLTTDKGIVTKTLGIVR